MVESARKTVPEHLGIQPADMVHSFGDNRGAGFAHDKVNFKKNVLAGPSITTPERPQQAAVTHPEHADQPVILPERDAQAQEQLGQLYHKAAEQITAAIDLESDQQAVVHTAISQAFAAIDRPHMPLAYIQARVLAITENTLAMYERQGKSGFKMTDGAQEIITQAAAGDAAATDKLRWLFIIDFFELRQFSDRLYYDKKGQAQISQNDGESRPATSADLVNANLDDKKALQDPVVVNQLETLADPYWQLVERVQNSKMPKATKGIMTIASEIYRHEGAFKFPVVAKALALLIGQGRWRVHRSVRPVLRKLLENLSKMDEGETKEVFASSEALLAQVENVYKKIPQKYLVEPVAQKNHSAQPSQPADTETRQKPRTKKKTRHYVTQSTTMALGLLVASLFFADPAGHKPVDTKSAKNGIESTKATKKVYKAKHEKTNDRLVNNIRIDGGSIERTAGGWQVNLSNPKNIADLPDNKRRAVAVTNIDTIEAVVNEIFNQSNDNKFKLPSVVNEYSFSSYLRRRYDSQTRSLHLVSQVPYLQDNFDESVLVQLLADYREYLKNPGSLDGQELISETVASGIIIVEQDHGTWQLRMDETARLHDKAKALLRFIRLSTGRYPTTYKEFSFSGYIKWAVTDPSFKRLINQPSLTKKQALEIHAGYLQHAAGFIDKERHEKRTIKDLQYLASLVQEYPDIKWSGSEETKAQVKPRLQALFSQLGLEASLSPEGKRYLAQSDARREDFVTELVKYIQNGDLEKLPPRLPELMKKLFKVK